MNHPLKLGGILFLLTAICVGILGAVNSVTKPIIERNEIASEEKAMKSLISEADSFVNIEQTGEKDIKKASIAKKGDDTVGYVLRVEPNGYGGVIKMLIGISLEGKVKGIRILEHSETPGFGAEADKDSFKNQFFDKQPPLKVSKNKGNDDEIQAIAGATITSTAVTSAVNAAAQCVKDHQAEWGEQS